MPVAVRSYGQRDHDGRPCEPVGEMKKESQRRLVGPLRVIDGEQRRGAFGEVDHQPIQSMQGGERDVMPRARCPRRSCIHSVPTRLGCFAVLIGGVVGTAIGSSRVIDRELTPTIDFIAAVPGAAMVPVAVLLLGAGQLSGVVVVALIVSWPILLNNATAVRAIPAVRLEMSRTIGLSRPQQWSKVIVPSLIPGMMLGVRVAASLAVIITLLVDIFGAGTGLGRLLVESQQRFDASAAWGLLLIVGVFGYLMSLLLSWLERQIAVGGLQVEVAYQRV